MPPLETRDVIPQILNTVLRIGMVPRGSPLDLVKSPLGVVGPSLGFDSTLDLGPAVGIGSAAVGIGSATVGLEDVHSMPLVVRHASRIGFRLAVLDLLF
jgi:hypothetical protein